MKSVSEWSLEFDLLYNNIASDKAPGLNEYEKSVFLTRAQERVVVALYNGTLGAAFESTEAVTQYLAALVRQCKPTLVVPQDDDPEATPPVVAPDFVKKLIDGSTVYALPGDLLFITSEFCSVSLGGCTSGAVIVPVTQDEFWRTVRNPFKGPNGNRVLRLSYASISGKSTKDITGEGATTDAPFDTRFVELVPAKGATVSEYILRYIARPEPIILDTLSGGLSVDGKTAEKTCQLDEALHHSILSEAVRMAKESWTA